MADAQIIEWLKTIIPAGCSLLTAIIYIHSKLKELEIRLETLKEELNEAKKSNTKTCLYHGKLVENIVTKDFFNAEMENIKNWLNRIENKINDGGLKR